MLFFHQCVSIKSNELGWGAWFVSLARSGCQHSDFQDETYKLVGKEVYAKSGLFSLRLYFAFLIFHCLHFQSESLGATHLFECLVGISVTGTLAIYSYSFSGC